LRFILCLEHGIAVLDKGPHIEDIDHLRNIAAAVLMLVKNAGIFPIQPPMMTAIYDVHDEAGIEFTFDLQVRMNFSQKPKDQLFARCAELFDWLITGELRLSVALTDKRTQAMIHKW